MIEKSKIKLKKGIAFVLAALQIGLVSSCAKKVSEDDYNKALEAIEKLESENSARESELEALKEEINKLQGDANTNTPETNVTVNTTGTFNLATAKQIGIPEEIYNLSEVKAIVDELNNVLNSRENVQCEVKAGAVSNQVKFIVNDNEYYSVLYKANEYLYFTMVNPDNTLTYSVSLDNAKTIDYLGYNVEWNVDGKSYTMDSTQFYKSYNGVITSISYNGPDINNPRNQFSMYVYLEKMQDIYKLKFNDVDQKHDTSKKNLVTIEISKEDYETLKALIDSYKEKGNYGDVIAYCGESLLQVINKYYMEDECIEYIPILDGSINVDLTEQEEITNNNKPSKEEQTKPTEPVPTEPKEPTPTEPKPTEPVPTEPKPTEPTPTEPVPTEPEVTEPEITEPEQKPENNNVIVAFNNDNASEIGLSSDDLNNSNIKDAINRLNAYLKKYTEAYGEVHYYNDNVNHVVYYYVNDLSVEEIINNNIAYIGYDNRLYEISLNAPLNDKSYYAQIGLGNGNKETTALSAYTSWNYNGSYYSVDELLLASNWTQKQIRCENESVVLIACAEKYDQDYALRLSANGSEHDIFVAKEDYDVLINTFNAYAASEENGNVFAYAKDTLVGLIQKYGKEAECADFIELVDIPSMTR